MRDVDALRAIHEHATYRGLTHTITQISGLDVGQPGILVHSSIPTFYRWARSINADRVFVGGVALEAAGSLSAGVPVRVFTSLPADVLRRVGWQGQSVELARVMSAGVELAEAA